MEQSADTGGAERVNALATELLGLVSADVASEIGAVLRGLSRSVEAAHRACRPGFLRRILLLSPSAAEIRAAVERANADVNEAVPQLVGKIDLLRGRIACFHRIAEKTVLIASPENPAAHIAFTTACNASSEEKRLLRSVIHVVKTAVPLWRTAAAGYLLGGGSPLKVADAAECLIDAAVPAISFQQNKESPK